MTKCNQCKTEYEGQFCPNCGAKTETETQQTANNQSAPDTGIKPPKKKKPFFLKWWFMLIAIIAVGGVISLLVIGGGEKILWDDIVLSDILPQPPSDKGKVITNSADELWIDINGLSEKQYAGYAEDCEEKGFDIDAESKSNTFEAFNSDGYKLNLSYYSSKSQMNVVLKAPMEMGSITWPTSTAGEQLPIPKSTLGQFSYEQDDSFSVYVGNTPKSDYDEYVNACSEKGFNIDYDKGENYYYADNDAGWQVSLRYQGNNVMSIKIDAPDQAVSTAAPTSSTEKEETTTTANSITDDISPDFKAAMDSYESFMNEYVEFMKKYKANPSDLNLLADYSDYLSKYADFVENFEKWESEDLNAYEAAYYIDVQARVNKKLLEIAN